jgi:GNAT superfamily N-acetyltransferase
MRINFQPLNKYDANYLEIIALYREAFPGAQHIPTCFLRYKLRNGKKGFYILYKDDDWIGLIYSTEYADIVFVHFLAISAALRSAGYGSKVMESLNDMHPGKRTVLNIEALDESAENYQQRIKRKAFYEKNGFSASGYFVKESAGQQEMLVRGGSVCKEEIDAMYKNLLGHTLSFLMRPKVTKI